MYKIDHLADVPSFELIGTRTCINEYHSAFWNNQLIFTDTRGIVVWDLETKTLLRRVIVSEVSEPWGSRSDLLTANKNVDILSLSILHSDLYTCSANGQVQVSDESVY